MQPACVMFYCFLWPVQLCSIFLHYLKMLRFSKISFEQIMCVLNFSTIFFRTFPILRRNGGDKFKNVYESSCEVPNVLVRFYWNFNFQDRCSKNIQTANFMIIRPLGAQLFHARRDGQSDTDMTKLIVAFPNFANAPKNASFKFKSPGLLWRRNW
jgi:hypothetical protein